MNGPLNKPEVAAAHDLECIQRHREHIELYPDGTWLCRLCVEKRELANDARSALLRLKLGMGIQVGLAVAKDGVWTHL